MIYKIGNLEKLNAEVEENAKKMQIFIFSAFNFVNLATSAFK